MACKSDHQHQHHHHHHRYHLAVPRCFDWWELYLTSASTTLNNGAAIFGGGGGAIYKGSVRLATFRRTVTVRFNLTVGSFSLVGRRVVGRCSLSLDDGSRLIPAHS
jgi:hypothetical protein